MNKLFGGRSRRYDTVCLPEYSYVRVLGLAVNRNTVLRGGEVFFFFREPLWGFIGGGAVLGNVISMAWDQYKNSAFINKWDFCYSLRYQNSLV
jgi:hypothetical protein